MRSDLSYFFGEGVGADSLQINPVQYPDRKVVERCAMIRDFGNRTELVLEMWSRVKGDNLNTGIVLLIFSVFGVLFILAGIRQDTQIPAETTPPPKTEKKMIKNPAYRIFNL